MVSVWNRRKPNRPEPWPTDPAWATARLTPVIRDIDQRDDEEHEALLVDLLRTAWPTVWTQDQ
jgi:hypothetical protein